MCAYPEGLEWTQTRRKTHQQMNKGGDRGRGEGRGRRGEMGREGDEGGEGRGDGGKRREGRERINVKLMFEAIQNDSLCTCPGHWGQRLERSPEQC